MTLLAKMNIGHRLRPPFRCVKREAAFICLDTERSSGAHSKFDKSGNLRKIEIFGIIYIEGKEKYLK